MSDREIIDLEELGCPSLKRLPEINSTRCDLHPHFMDYMCAAHNVHKLQNMVHEQSKTYTWYNTALGALYPGALPLERPSAFKPGALTATALRALTAATLTPKALTPTALTPGALTPGALTPGALTPGATWHLAP
ncbi:hypothetical protein QAD02_020054 [Eretmocerus hayati]|uniref:Uncharacterized protein n=1 Tax=Eretmocerus hayati TaxID=131215 RepID=A0ACC2PLK1_9HYME|nr:hypothetical protein QAD02_020054 [Eretmocerus hayati]